MQKYKKILDNFSSQNKGFVSNSAKKTSFEYNGYATYI